MSFGGEMENGAGLAASRKDAFVGSPSPGTVGQPHAPKTHAWFFRIARRHEVRFCKCRGKLVVK